MLRLRRMVGIKTEKTVRPIRHETLDHIRTCPFSKGWA
jgi:hypothetical protein